MRKVLIIKPDVNFCSQNLPHSWGDAACEGFWRENFPNGITASLLESYGSFSRMLFAGKELPLLPPAPYNHNSDKASVVPAYHLLTGLSMSACSPNTAGHRQAVKTAGSALLSAGLAVSVCTHPAGLELAPVQPAGNAGEHKFISKKTGSASYQI